MRVRAERPFEVMAGVSLIVVTIGVMAFDQARTLRTIGNGLSSTADPWTESDTVRAAEGYADLGFLANWGLPDLCYGNRFAEVGTKRMLRDGAREASQWMAANAAEHPSADRLVYTHYPPGPHLILGVSTVLFGPGRIAAYRLVPVSFCVLAILYLWFEMIQALGWLRGGLAAAAFAVVPMFTDMMHGLSYQGYSLAAVLIELGLCLRIARRAAITVAQLAAFAIVGFFQGFLGFDYIFLVALAPACIALVDGSFTITLRHPMVKASIAAVGGFVAAQVVHFLQVILYFGSVRAAVDDYISIGSFRAMGTTYDNGAALPSRLQVLGGYLTTYTALPLHIGVGICWLTLLGLVALAALRLVRPGRVPRSAFVATVASLAVSSLWVVAMPQYSAQHWHFIPRHYFLALFVPVLAIMKATESWNPA
jgi:hypothetical protein